MLASKIDPSHARAIVGPLFGLYELRAVDAHLRSNNLEASMKLIGIDAASPPAVQGYQMLHVVVTVRQEIGKVIEDRW